MRQIIKSAWTQIYTKIFYNVVKIKFLILIKCFFPDLDAPVQASNIQ